MRYYVNKNAQIKTGERIIHKEGCTRIKSKKNLKELGDFEEDRVALWEAAKYYFGVNGCSYCCKEIHLKR